MAYGENETKRLTALLESIPDRVTYRNTPALEEIRQIVADHLAQERPADAETLSDSVAILRYLGDRYEYLGRFSVAAQFYDRALTLAAQLHREYGEETEYAGDMLYRAIKAHNFYVDDDCQPLLALCREFVSRTDEIAQDAFNPRRHLKHDPVEMTEAYLAVIDGAEEYVEQNRTLHGHGACHGAWHLKREYLLQHDIDWRSPTALNPRVHFD